MELKELKKIIKLFESSAIASLKLETEKYNVEISKEQKGVPTITMPMASGSEVTKPHREEVVKSKTEEKVVLDEKLIAIKSPMVGTFYGSPKPESAPYIKVGDKVKIGQVVCIVEAMKLFNEIESEHDGVVEKVLVDTMDSIEYGQELFLVRVE
ncbi:acetyl-CoA carboxylase biotin carboxyl carrier protein [bacterium]|jgi:acetyl-CoA carboxylase biotin carboxyl carrier protein|nr:acetyl-CoA carboxylase biotin carboxyl carrier protein [bacterium]MBT3580909.1 acetyl-CoA carboxylase biotin carboxyl carrier protein [bacterium]MBT7088781.1 acetyl-CoA carboxylase biotin carboxyl carrier protein [bacterium]